jgi:hypothetical protein
MFVVDFDMLRNVTDNELFITSAKLEGRNMFELGLGFVLAAGAALGHIAMLGNLVRIGKAILS